MLPYLGQDQISVEVAEHKPLVVSFKSGFKYLGGACRRSPSFRPWHKAGAGGLQNIFFGSSGLGLVRKEGGRPPRAPPLDPPLHLPMNSFSSD